MLSHDMKNPLTAVIGSIDIIREGCLGAVNDEQEEYLQSAIDSCNEVVTMIDNLLDIRKFEAGKIQMAVHTYNAHELIGKIANQFARPARHDGIELSVDLEPGTSEITVDKNAYYPGPRKSARQRPEIHSGRRQHNRFLPHYPWR